MQVFSQDILTVFGFGYFAASQTSRTTVAIDMVGGGQGFDAICFVISLGTVSSGSVMTFTVYDNASNSNSGGTAISAATAAVTAITPANGTAAQSGTNCAVALTDIGGATSSELLIVDVLLPQVRYVYGTLSIGTANCQLNGCNAHLYRSKRKGVTQNSATAATGLFVASS